jgi:hypothetical protein
MQKRPLLYACDALTVAPLFLFQINMYHFSASTLRAPESSPRAVSDTHHQASGLNDRPAAEEASMIRSATMPERYEFLEVHRTGSGGLIMRKRTFEEQKELSREKALQLSEIYEMSDVRTATLNKKASFQHKAIEYKGKPSFAQIDPKQAALAYRQKQDQAYERRKEDPLLMERERKVKMKIENPVKSNSLRNKQDRYLAPQCMVRSQGVEVVLAYNLPGLC